MTYDPTLYHTLRKFAEKTHGQVGDYGYAVGYFASMLERIAHRHPEIEAEILNQLNEHLAEISTQRTSRGDEVMRTPIAEAAVEYYRSGADKTQRFGQFYINRYMPSDTVWPELFYEEDSAKALNIILGID